ncbi:MAG: porin family protein [Bacteroidota bacterium]
MCTKSLLFRALILFVLISLLPSYAPAQASVRLGIDGGLNFANASVTNVPSAIALNSRTVPTFGGVAELSFHNVAFIRGEIRYTPKGIGATASDPKYVSSMTAKFEYLEIPIVIGVKFGPGPFKPYIFAGPNLGIRLSAELESDVLGKTYSKNVEDNTKSTDFALDFGGGLLFEADSQWAIFIDGRYSLGLTEIGGSRDFSVNSEYKSRDIKVIAGILFGL